MVEYHPQLWNANNDKQIIHADFNAAEIDTHYHPETEIIGDLAHTLWMLNEPVDAMGGLPFDVDTHAAVRREMQADFAEYQDDDTQGIIKPQKVLWDVRQIMGPARYFIVRRGRAQNVDSPPLSVP